jgi:hypothetical protein
VDFNAASSGRVPGQLVGEIGGLLAQRGPKGIGQVGLSRVEHRRGTQRMRCLAAQGEPIERHQAIEGEPGEQ